MIFQGDIIISYEELVKDLDVKEADARGLLNRQRRNAGSGASPAEEPSNPKVYNKLWPNCRVPYTIEPYLGKNNVKSGIKISLNKVVTIQCS